MAPLIANVPSLTDEQIEKTAEISLLAWQNWRAQTLELGTFSNNLRLLVQSSSKKLDNAQLLLEVLEKSFQRLFFFSLFFDARFGSKTRVSAKLPFALAESRY